MKTENTEKKPPDLQNVENILKFFQRMFRLYINAPKEATSKSKLIEAYSFGKNSIYELSVEHEENIESRRMSIGPLGEGSGSKSKCYYVVYDDHIVVKIPPVPITDFKKYIKSIRADRRIVNKVAPKECITPGVAVIMKRVYTFADQKDIDRKELEERYIKLLSLKSDLQKYLKIGGGFVYFMDLSRYLMMVDVLNEMHSEKSELLIKEITEHFESIMEMEVFEERFGPENTQLCMDVRNIYKKCESEIRRLMIQTGISSSVLTYKIKEWIITHFAGKELSKKEKGLEIEFVSNLNQSLKKVLDENRIPVEAYKKIAKESIRQKVFMRERPQMAGIITNIIELIAWLSKTGIAMRDLKPDNIIVVADEAAEYPHYLKSANEFKLGLIDVETAVVVKPSDSKDIEQPQLGGTPFFATPAHLMTNVLLAETFNDLPRALILQDMYAAVVMIYNVITGERLFLQTARLFPIIKKNVQEAVKEKKPLPEIIANISRKFWGQAVKEFRAKTAKNEKKLRSISVAIPKSAIKLVLSDALNEKKSIAVSIQNIVRTQVFFKDKKKQNYLIKADHNTISQLEAKWGSNNYANKTNPDDKAKILQFLKNIMRLKLLSEQLDWIIHSLHEQEPKISAYALLNLLFNIILRFMYKEEWGPLPTESSDENIDGMDDASLGLTIL